MDLSHLSKELESLINSKIITLQFIADPTSLDGIAYMMAMCAKGGISFSRKNIGDFHPFSLVESPININKTTPIYRYTLKRHFLYPVEAEFVKEFFIKHIGPYLKSVQLS